MEALVRRHGSLSRHLALHKIRSSEIFSHIVFLLVDPVTHGRMFEEDERDKIEQSEKVVIEVGFKDVVNVITTRLHMPLHIFEAVLSSKHGFDKCSLARKCCITGETETVSDAIGRTISLLAWDTYVQDDIGGQLLKGF